VAQRLALRDKMREDGHEPHLLMMSATPIPRTLAMSYYADLDVSTIDELPPGRTPVVTKVVNEPAARRGHRTHPRPGGRRAGRSTGSAR
jgi:ATP-dependent DNA helicase RecG